MTPLQEITDPIADDFTRFEELYKQTVTFTHPLSSQISRSILGTSGKRMRPMLTLLIARLHGQICDEHLVAAVVMEVTHNASLVHDDVLDEAYTRRGEFTAMAVLRSKGAVLAGDYLLTRGVSLGVKTGNYRAVDISATTLQQLVEGELQQMRHALLLDTTVENYFEIIKLKTAYLLGAAASLGAPIEKADHFYKFGELLGEAFQIQDDILDYVGDKTGKLPLNDIRESKITLPLLLALENNPSKTKIVKKHLRQAAQSQESAQYVADFVLANNGIEKAAVIVAQKRDAALALLNEYEDCPAKESLLKYANFISVRKH